ncbi:MAG: hypothetical protein ACW97X_12620, partial [Candidatus Hodarchaeales archaeon]
MPKEYTFSFEEKRVNNKTIFIIKSPAHRIEPKIVSFILILVSSTFLVFTLLEYILQQTDITLVFFLTFFLCFSVLFTVIFFAQFTVIFMNHSIIIGHRFWKIHRSETVSVYDIASLQWDIKKSSGEYDIYLIIKAIGRTYRFQPLGTAITTPQP